MFCAVISDWLEYQSKKASYVQVQRLERGARRPAAQLFEQRARDESRRWLQRQPGCRTDGHCAVRHAHLTSCFVLWLLRKVGKGKRIQRIKQYAYTILCSNNRKNVKIHNDVWIEYYSYFFPHDSFALCWPTVSLLLLVLEMTTCQKITVDTSVLDKKVGR